MKTLQDSLKERLKDPEFRAAYEYESIVQELALKIARLRQEVGLSQKGLAEMLDTKQQVISRIENGNQNLSLNMLYKISKVLGVNLAVDLKKVS